MGHQEVLCLIFLLVSVKTDARPDPQPKAEAAFGSGHGGHPFTNLQHGFGHSREHGAYGRSHNPAPGPWYGHERDLQGHARIGGLGHSAINDAHLDSVGGYGHGVEIPREHSFGCSSSYRPSHGYSEHGHSRHRFEPRRFGFSDFIENSREYGDLGHGNVRLSFRHGDFGHDGFEHGLRRGGRRSNEFQQNLGHSLEHQGYGRAVLGRNNFGHNSFGNNYGYTAFEHDLGLGHRNHERFFNYNIIPRVIFPYPIHNPTYNPIYNPSPETVHYRRPIQGYHIVHKLIHPVTPGYEAVHGQLQPSVHEYQSVHRQIHPTSFGYEKEAHKQVHPISHEHKTEFHKQVHPVIQGYNAIYKETHPLTRGSKTVIHKEVNPSDQKYKAQVHTEVKSPVVHQVHKHTQRTPDHGYKVEPKQYNSGHSHIKTGYEHVSSGEQQH